MKRTYGYFSSFRGCWMHVYADNKVQARAEALALGNDVKLSDIFYEKDFSVSPLCDFVH